MKDIKYIKEIIGSIIAVVIGAGSILTGWQWVETQFQKKEDAALKYSETFRRSTELYLEIKMSATEEAIKDLERKIDAGMPMAPWEQRKYESKTAEMVDLIAKDNKLKGL